MKKLFFFSDLRLRSSTQKLIFIISGALFLIGLFSRLSPLVNQDGRLFWQFVTEDGYLMLTIARNLAMGSGMSTSDGTILTNGVQPLATVLFAGLFYLVDGDKQQGLVVILFFSILVSILTAWMIYKLCHLIFEERMLAGIIGILAASLWFASPVILRHTVNYLETGIYILLILITTYYYLRNICISPGAVPSYKIISFGILLGLLFLSRNDGALLIFAFCIHHMVRPLLEAKSVLLVRRTFESILFGGISVIVALPWLYYNLTVFDHLMPISGVAQSHGAQFANNLAILPAIMFEYIFVFLPIPFVFEKYILAQIVGAISIVGLIVLLSTIYRNANDDQRSLLMVFAIYITGLASFYSLFFGAPHFMNRYLSPASPFFTILFASVVIWFACRYATLGRSAKIVFAIGVLSITAGLNYRFYHNGFNNGHRQVVEWVDKNVSDDIWVAAVQTGTLGFFHDRTYNLDGKVNPDALRTIVEHGTVYPYVIARDEIRYIVDWSSIVDWVIVPRFKFSSHFDVLEKNENLNFAVLKRKTN